MAWEIYINMETSNESLSLLNQIANECYKMGQFYYSAKAFDVLERLDPDPEFWEGKRGAAIGVFASYLAVILIVPLLGACHARIQPLFSLPRTQNFYNA